MGTGGKTDRWAGGKNDLWETREHRTGCGSIADLAAQRAAVRKAATCSGHTNCIMSTSGSHAIPRLPCSSPLACEKAARAEVYSRAAFSSRFLSCTLVPLAPPLAPRLKLIAASPSEVWAAIRRVGSAQRLLGLSHIVVFLRALLLLDGRNPFWHVLLGTWEGEKRGREAESATSPPLSSAAATAPSSGSKQAPSGS